MQTHLSEFLSLALIHQLAVAAPGPDFAVVFRQCVRHGRKTAVFTAIGVGLGILLHMSYTLLGMGLLISRYATALTAMKIIGAAWLLYLGLQSLRAVSAPISFDNPACDPDKTESWRQAMWTGFLTNGLNPKVTLFFLAIFTAVVSRDTPLWIQAGYGVYLSLATMAWFVLVAWVVGHPAVRNALLRSGVWLERLTGVILIGFAVRLAAF